MEKFKLWESDAPYFQPEIGQEEPAIVPYLLNDGKIHPCVLVFPGGGYHHRAGHEGEPVAQWLNEIGFNAFVVEYRLTPYNYKAILADAFRSIRLVRYRAAEWGIDPDKVGVLGFSAGGHLAYMTSVLYPEAELRENDPVDKMSSRPDLAVLCYAVASFERFPSMHSANNFLGDEVNLEMLHKFSTVTNITEDTPPMFIWHTVEDKSVAVENALETAIALRAKRVPFALHVYPNGGHGQNLARHIPQTCRWTLDCEVWLRETFGTEE